MFSLDLCFKMVHVETYMGVVFFMLAVYCVCIVFYYAEPGFPWHSYITLTIGYFAAFGILLLVPIDIANCVTERRVGSIDAYNTYVSNSNILSQAYNTFFSIILIFGSIVLVYEEYFNTDGTFILLIYFVLGHFLVCWLLFSIIFFILYRLFHVCFSIIERLHSNGD